MVEKINFYTVTLNDTNSVGTYEFVFQAFRNNADFGSGLVSSFVLSISDPQTGTPIPCSIDQGTTYAPTSTSTTSIGFTNPGMCSEVYIGIDKSWYPGPIVSNSGYVTFADGSNTYYPADWLFPGSAAGPPPPTGVSPTQYPNGTVAPYAGLNVESASVLYR
jgi:hypothetical protein